MIIFYAMEGCTFCVKAEKELIELLDTGFMVKKGSGEAPPGTTGFPTFVNVETNTTVVGYKPKEELLVALGVTSKDLSREEFTYSGAESREDYPCKSVFSYRTLKNSW